MKCSDCGSYNVNVIETRSTDNIVYRRRKCNSCGNIMYTKEIEDPEVKLLLNRTHREVYNK